MGRAGALNLLSVSDALVAMRKDVGRQRRRLFPLEKDLQVDTVDYRARFHRALSDAFAARTQEERAAHFDLASGYHEKLSGPADMFPDGGDYRKWVIG